MTVADPGLWAAAPAQTARVENPLPGSVRGEEGAAGGVDGMSGLRSMLVLKCYCDNIDKIDEYLGGKLNKIHTLPRWARGAGDGRETRQLRPRPAGCHPAGRADYPERAGGEGEPVHGRREPPAAPARRRRRHRTLRGVHRSPGGWLWPDHHRGGPARERARRPAAANAAQLQGVSTGPAVLLRRRGV